MKHIPIIIILILGLAGIPASPVPAAPLADPSVMGMVVRDPWYDGLPGQPDVPNQVSQDRMGATLAQLGVRWVRLEFHIDGTSALSTTQVARNDYFINQVAPRYGLKVLGLLGFDLVRERGPRDLLLTDTLRLHPIYGGGVNDYMATWLDRALMITTRYGSAVQAYEVLNEQNRLPPTGDGIPATIAARVHTKFYRLFKGSAATPGQEWRTGVQVIVGGLHPAGTGTYGKPGYVSDRQYLAQLYASDGFTSYAQDPNLGNGRYPLDGIGYHPYPEEIHLETRAAILVIETRMAQVRTLINSLDPANPPFWITEIGYNASYRTQDVQGQAAFLGEVFAQLAVRGDVASIFWFKYEDFPPASGPNAQRWGVVRIPFVAGSCEGGVCYDPSGAPDVLRPAFYMYRDLAGLPVYYQYLPLAAQ